jgi:hypothetical protein
MKGWTKTIGKTVGTSTLAHQPQRHTETLFRHVRKTSKSDYQLRHVSPSVRPHGTTRLPLDGFSWTLCRFWWNWIVEYVSKILQENLSFIKNLTRITDTLHKDLCTFMIISRWFLLRIRNVSDKSCRENQNTNFMFNNFFPKIVPFMR